MPTTLFTTDVTEVWDFDNDATGVNGNDLTANGAPTYGSTSPPQGTHYASLASASSQYFSLADDPTFDLVNTDYTIACWVYFDTRANMSIVSKGQPFGAHQWVLRTIYTSGSNFTLQMRHENSNTIHDCSSGFHANATTDLTWYHVVASYDVSAGQITWWVSDTTTFGSEINASAVSMGNYPSASTDALNIGAINGGDFFNGSLDEVAIFNSKAVSAAEAEEIYKGTASGGWREAGGGGSIIPQIMHHRRQML